MINNTLKVFGIGKIALYTALLFIALYFASKYFVQFMIPADTVEPLKTSSSISGTSSITNKKQISNENKDIKSLEMEIKNENKQNKLEFAKNLSESDENFRFGGTHLSKTVLEDVSIDLKERPLTKPNQICITCTPDPDIISAEVKRILGSLDIRTEDSINSVLLGNGKQAFINGKRAFENKGVIISSNKEQIGDNPILVVGNKLGSASGFIVEDDIGNVYNSINGEELLKNNITNKTKLKYKDEETYIDSNGQLRYSNNGEPVKDINGNEVFFDKEFGFHDGKGNSSSFNGNLKTKTGEIVDENGSFYTTSNFSPNSGKVGRADSLKFDNKETYLDANGQLRYMNGDPVTDDNGKEIFFDEELGFHDGNGHASALNGKLTTSSGTAVNQDGSYGKNYTLQAENGYGFAPASIETLKAFSRRNTSNTIEKSTNIKENNKADKPIKLGRFWLSPSGSFLNFNKEELSFKRKVVKAAQKNNKISINIKDLSFDQDSMEFSSITIPVEEKYFLTSDGVKFGFDGELIHKSGFHLDIGDRFLKSKKGYAYYLGEKVYVSKTGDVKTSNGFPVLDAYGQKIYWSLEKGITSNSKSNRKVNAIDAIFTTKKQIVLNHLGEELKNTKGIYEEFDKSKNVKVVSNTLLTYKNMPIYSSNMSRLKIKSENGEWHLKDIAGNNHMNIKYKPIREKKGEWFVRDVKIQREEIIAFDHKNKPIYIFSGEVNNPNMSLYQIITSKPVLGFDGLPVKYVDGILTGSNGRVIEPILDYETNDGNLINFDSSPIFLHGNKIPKGNETSLLTFAGEEFELLPILQDSENDFDEVLTTYMPFTVSQKGIFYSHKSNNKIITQNGFPLKVINKKLIGGGGIDALVTKVNSNKILNGFIFSKNNNQIYFLDQPLSREMIDIDRNRYVIDKKLIATPMIIVKSYREPLSLDGKIINFDEVNKTSGLGDFIYSKGLVTNKNGEQLFWKGKAIGLDDKGRVVGFTDRKPINELEGVRYTHASGFIDQFGNPANVDYLHTSSGDQYNNNGAKLSGKLRKANIGEFWVDDQNKLYTGDKKPVLANNQHIEVDGEGNAYIKGNQLVQHGNPIKVDKNGELYDPDNPEEKFIINDNGFVVDDNFGSIFGESNFFTSSIDMLSKMKSSLMEGSSSASTLPEEIESASNRVMIDELHPNEKNSKKGKKIKEKVTNDAPEESIVNKSKLISISEKDKKDLLESDYVAIQSSIASIKNIINSSYQSGTKYYGSKETSTESNKTDSGDESPPSLANTEQSEPSQDQLGFELANISIPPKNAIRAMKRGDRLQVLVEAPYTSNAPSALNYPILRVIGGKFNRATVRPLSVVQGDDDLYLTFNSLDTQKGVSLRSATPWGFSIDAEDGFSGSNAIVTNHFWKKLPILFSLSLLSSGANWIEMKSTESVEDTTSSETSTSVVNAPSSDELALMLAGNAVQSITPNISDALKTYGKEYKLKVGQMFSIQVVQDVFVDRKKYKRLVSE